MRFILIISSLFLSAFALHAQEESGKLILEPDFVVFRCGSSESKYDFAKIPGLKTLEFIKKAMVSGDNEIDVSELVLQTSTGEKITLVMNKPELITRITDGTSVQWTGLKK